MVMQAIRGLLGTPNQGNTASLSEFYQSLYPEDVRYALAHKEARLGKSEINSLVGRFMYEAVYLVTKGLAFSVEQQGRYLQALTRLYLQVDFHPDDLRQLLYEHVKLLPDDASLAGAKLLQLSRAGSDHWQQAFHDLAESCYAENPQALPCLVAYTPMIGYRHFVEVFSRDSLGKLQLLVPEWMLDIDNDLMGYEVVLGPEATVTAQDKNECLYGAWVCLHDECPLKHRFCEDAIFIDDTINTGETSSKLRSFWQSEYGANVPSERIRVITDLRTQVTNMPQVEAGTKDTNYASNERD
jgi:hypothetical protein